MLDGTNTRIIPSTSFAIFPPIKPCKYVSPTSLNFSPSSLNMNGAPAPCKSHIPFSHFALLGPSPRYPLSAPYNALNLIMSTPTGHQKNQSYWQRQLGQYIISNSG